jgi:hypothetical protein
LSLLKATGNKNRQAPHYADVGELVQDVAAEFQHLLNEHPDLLLEGAPPGKIAALTKELKAERLQAEQEGGIYGYAVGLCLKHSLPVHSAVAAALWGKGCKLLAELADFEEVREWQKMLKPVQAPAPTKNRIRRGSHKTEKALLRPKWVGVSEAARVLGLQRSTILKWYASGKIVLPVDGHTRTYQLQRGALGQVNLTLLQHIAQHKRTLPGPGRRLGAAPGRELVAAAVRAHGSPSHAAEYSRVCKALSLLEGVKQGALLHAARRHLNRVIQRRRRV